jgi:uncharacterized membrane protein
MSFENAVETVGKAVETVGIAAIVVVIRTFLSFTLEVEIDGRWPWQRTNEEPV